MLARDPADPDLQQRAEQYGGPSPDDESRLHDQGYPSIGCWPCTRAVAAGEADERAGRWAGQAKTECGLHSLDSSQL